MNNDIDFVLLWVDMNDPRWRAKYNAYINDADKQKTDTRDCKYRDWDNLRYWFRAVEKFAPWVRRVHFVTSDQRPPWLNVNAPKLHLVDDSDYMPAEYLPLFNCNPLEINLHRIAGLADKFVYFNDDMFLLKPVKPERFFKNNLPVDMGILNALSTEDGVGGYCKYNNLLVLKKHFTKRPVLSKNKMKWFNPAYGKYLLRTMLLLPWSQFTGFYDHHLPTSFLKSTFEEVWALEEPRLLDTCRHRFREMSDINQWLFRYWQLASGKFYPYNVTKDSAIYNFAAFATVRDYDVIARAIKGQKKSVICIFEDDSIDFEQAKRVLNAAFETILPEKSSFER